VAGLLSGLSEVQSGQLLEEIWALAGIEAVGGRGPADIAARLIRKAEAELAPALTADQSSAIREFMAISAAPSEALARVRALAGKGAEELDLAIARWSARLGKLEAKIPPDRLSFAPALGHAFDYYDGLTFEVRSAALGEDRPVAVGGRYDALLSRLGGASDSRAVGCMVRPWRAWSEGEA
jgi:ATP phosphoribosyltransferase regulatory subunit